MRTPQLLAGLCLAVSACIPLSSLAQESFPAQTVKITVGFPPGSSTDAATRVVASKLGQILGQAVIVENRPGASSNIAAKSIAATSPDGYNLFVATIANAINSNLMGHASFDIAKNYDAIAMLGSVPNLLVVHPSLGADSLKDLIRVAKAKPGEVMYASSGNGTAPHLAGELFAKTAGVKMVHVPYKGSSSAMADLLAGRVTVMFAPASTVLPHIKSGKLKALASTSLKRTSIAPDLPTLSELGLKGFESSVWFGLVTPSGTPAKVQATLVNAVQAALDSSDVQSQFKAQGIEVVKAGPKEFSRYMASETDKWGKVIESSGVKLD